MGGFGGVLVGGSGGVLVSGSGGVLVGGSSRMLLSLPPSTAVSIDWELVLLCFFFLSVPTVGLDPASSNEGAPLFLLKAAEDNVDPSFSTDGFLLLACGTSDLS